MGWIAAIDGYDVCLVDGTVVCRPTGGKALKSMPKAVRESAAVTSLCQVQEWLERHARECLRTVEEWLLRGQPVPAATIAAVWPDVAWRSVLTDVVIAPVNERDGWLLDEAGFLRDAGERLGS